MGMTFFYREVILCRGGTTVANRVNQTGHSPQYARSANAQHAGTITASESLGNQFSPHPGHRHVLALETALGGQGNQRHRSDQTSRSPAVDKSEKRRQQNRTSQLAFRQRNKMTLMTLQEELDQSLLVNETLYGTIEVLLEKTEDLKRSIEDVLAARLKRGRSESYNSPRTSSSLPLYARGRRV